MTRREMDRDLAKLGALDEPIRRKLYFHVAGSRRDVSRDRAARALRISRALAAFHLDRLVEDGFLEVAFRRVNRRKGPGAGRPAKLYRRSSLEIRMSIPERRYELAARVFARALEAGDPKSAVNEIAHREGLELARGQRGKSAQLKPRALLAALRDCGYEPYRAQDGCIRMRNCPFHALAESHRELVCHMNLGLVNGLLHALAEEGPTEAVDAKLDPLPNECCVALAPRE